MRERIAWFTPFSRNSAIGQISKIVCTELNKKFDITIFTATETDLIEADLKRITLSKEFQVQALDSYDHVIYNIGNDMKFHRDIFEISKKHKGIVIQHDKTMLGYFYELYLGHTNSDATSNKQNVYNFIKHYYYNLSDHEIDLGMSANKFSLLTPIFENAYGVFTHAIFFKDEIRQYTNLPSEYSYLPCKKPTISPDDKDSIFSLFKRDSKKFLLLSSGIVHPYKRLDKVTNILLRNKVLRANIQYVVVGSYAEEYGDNLKRISTTDLKDCLFMLGYQPTSVLESAIFNADMCINLRYPNSEVCSLSLLEQMSFGKPTVVIDSGIYAEMPDDSVIKISLENEEEELEKILINAVNDKKSYNSYGIKAEEFIEKNCTVATYAEKFSNFLSTYKQSFALAELQNNLIDNVKDVLKNLNFTYEQLPKTYDTIIDNICEIIDEKK